MRLLLGLVAVMALVTAAGAETPDPVCAVILERIFNDCPSSTLTTLNNYPSEIWIDDAVLDCVGFANLHAWRFSEDCTNPAEFHNDSWFSYEFDLVITGTGDGEAGLQIRPWWSESDGRFNVRSTDGEIACFGGRLPFFSFTGTFGLHYVKGDVIHLKVTYIPNELTELNPATIEYEVDYAGSHYTSGPLPFDQGNPNEPEHGFWGILNPAYAGGHLQAFIREGVPETQIRATWSNIVFENLEPTATKESTWGQMKGLYR